MCVWGGGGGGRGEGGHSTELLKQSLYLLIRWLVAPFQSGIDHGKNEHINHRHLHVAELRHFWLLSPVLVPAVAQVSRMFFFLSHEVHYNI